MPVVTLNKVKSLNYRLNHITSFMIPSYYINLRYMRTLINRMIILEAIHTHTHTHTHDYHIPISTSNKFET